MNEINFIALYRGACLLFAIVGVLIGIGLLFRPQIVISINNFLNTWISTRKVTKIFEKQVDSTEWLLKGRVMFAILVLLFSLILLIFSLKIKVIS